MFNMAPAFTTCLFFSCFFLDRWILVSLQGGPFPKPTLRITSGSETVRGGNLTLSCAAAAQDRDVTFALYRGNSISTQNPPGTEAVFHFTNVNSGHEGRYHCLYYSKGANRIESEPSDAVKVTLRDSYPNASVVLSPSVVARGGNLTINCTSEYPNMSFFLFKGSNSYRQEDPPGRQAVFVISGVRETDEGTYHCRYHPRYGPLVWADASESFQIRVLDLSKPSISYKLVWSSEDYKLNCSAPHDKTVKRFFLYQNVGKATIADRSPSPGSKSVTFPISGVNAGDGTEYRCSYQIQESGEILESPLSDPIQIGKDKQEETSTTTAPRNDGQMPSGDSNSSNMGASATLPIAVVCAVLLVVILSVALILYIKCKPKKAKDDIQKRNLPLNEEKKTDSLEPMYAIVTKGKTSNNTIAPEVKKQEEGGYDEGVTYAIINRDALKNQKKNAAPPFQHPEPTLYASVNIP